MKSSTPRIYCSHFLVLFLIVICFGATTVFASPKESFIKELASSDAALSEELFQTLKAGVDTMTVESNKTSAAVMDKVKGMGIAGADKELAFDVVASMSKKDKDNPLVLAMHKALEKLKASESNESEYVLKQRMSNAMKAAWPKSALKHYFTFPKMDKLYPIKNPPAVPAADPAFEKFKVPGTYFNNTFWDLINVPANELPQGALDTLFYLMYAPLSSADRRDVYWNPGTFIERYKERACPYAVDFLTHPERYGASKVYDRDLKHAQFCPDEVKKELLRSAFQVGWLTAESHLHPSKSVSEAVHKEVPDTPYGKPRSIPEMQLPDSEEMKKVEERFRDYQKRFEERAKGVSSSYDRSQVRRKVREEFDFKDKRNERAFERLILHDIYEERVVEHLELRKKQKEEREKRVSQPKPVATPFLKKISGSKALKDEQFLEHVKKKEKIKAIKRYRDLTGKSLRDAKNAVDPLIQY